MAQVRFTLTSTCILIAGFILNLFISYNSEDREGERNRGEAGTKSTDIGWKQRNNNKLFKPITNGMK